MRPKCFHVRLREEQRLATVFLEADAAVLQRMIAAGELKEVNCDGQDGA